MQIHAVLFDFGGVIAAEGFQQGLYAIAGKFGLDPKRFFQLANEAVYDSGYVTGAGTEKDYWDVVREHSSIVASDEELRREILSRFIPRDWMLETVDGIRQKGILTAILSDQSDWLDKLDTDHDIFRHFDAVFNSFHLGKTKRDSTTFKDVLKKLNTGGQETLFIDDSEMNIVVAREIGLDTIHFLSSEQLKRELCERTILNSAIS